MPIRVDLLALEPNIPGQARLTVKKWSGANEGLEFSIQRNQDQQYLQGDRQWSNNPFWFQVESFTRSTAEDMLETPVGPEVVDPLLEGSGSSNFRIELRELHGGLADQGVVRPAQGLLSSVAGGETRALYDGGNLSAAPDVVAVEIPYQPTPALAEPQSVAEPVSFMPDPVVTESVSPIPPTKRSSLLPVLLGVLFLLAIVLVLWFWLKKPTLETPAESFETPPVTTELAAASEPVVAEPCTLESMASQSELSFVQNCIRQSLDSDTLLDIIVTAKNAGHCGIAQRLYANRAQAGDVQIAHAYAREYDPQYHQPSTCFAEPDTATAAYWYETILASTPDDAQAEKRFKELQP